MSARSEYPAFPPGDPPALAPDPLFEKLRAQSGMIRVQLPYGQPTWLAVRHEDVKALLTDKRFSRADAVGPDEPRILPIIQKANILIATDGPGHDRLRAALAATFTVRGVERLRPRTQELTDAVLDAMERHGSPADLMESVALAIPVLVICELLGVPEAERARFRTLADSFSVPVLAQLTGEQIMGNGLELRDYLTALVARQRADPGADLLGSLCRTSDLSDEELVAIAVTVLIAGHEATADQLANLTYLLLTHPEQRRELRERPDRIALAVEELLRLVPLGVATGLPRRATEDVQIGGVLVRAGEFAMPVMTAANHDERVYEDPASVDFARRGAAHFTFGHGVHRCLGAALARMELQVAVGSLLRRFPDLRLAVPVEDIEWCTGGLVRAPVRLMVAW